MIRTLCLLIASCLMLGAQTSEFAKMVSDAKTRIKEIDVASYQKLSSSEKPVLVDVREDNEWTAGHAAGALHVSRGVLEARIEKQVPDKSAKVVVYCAAGHRSALAAESLQKMGYTNVFSLAGGFTAYKAAGLPTEK